MAKQKKFKGLSSRARRLLNAAEGLDVDFKRTPKSVSHDDLVAFANSADGGALLVGVDEEAGDDGVQKGKVVGCDVSDGSKLVIVNKAQQCRPPIHVEVFVENTGVSPFMRVEIPSSETKPHSTPSGTYKRRAEGRNATLDPSAIAEILLEREAELFRGRFAEAASGLRETLGQASSQLSALESSLRSILDSAEVAASEAGDASYTLRSLEDDVAGLRSQAARNAEALSDVQKRLAHLLEAQNIEDPVADTAANDLRSQFDEYIRANPDQLTAILQGFSVTVPGPLAARLTEERIRETLLAVCDEVSEELDESSGEGGPE
jgi:hypothetical protein